MERGKMELVKAIKNDMFSILYYASLSAWVFGPSGFDSLASLLYSLPRPWAREFQGLSEVACNFIGGKKC
jgi:hypothetical protein